MSYVMLIYESEDALAARSDEERKEAYWGAWGAYHKALMDAGCFVTVNSDDGGDR